MAKIDRFDGNLKAFASEQQTNERTLFGELVVADDLTSQITADFLRGWGIVGPSDQPTLQDFNAVGYTLGQLIAYLHQMGVAEYNGAQEYYADSVVTSGGRIYISLLSPNTGNNPATSPAQWRPVLTDVPDATTTVKGIVELATNAEAVDGLSSTLAVTPAGLAAAIAASPPVDTFNAPVATVAAAVTINLTAGAPSTSQIVISGSGVSIAGFTVAANRCFIVRFSGQNTLVNSASLVTNTGANIQVAAGDTCIIRATSANTVEVLCPRILASAAAGTLGQTRQDVTASRVSGTVYTNTTGRVIEINVGVLDGGGTSTWSMTVGGVFYDFGNPAGGVTAFVSTVLPGETYSLNVGGNSLKFWTEIR